MHQVPAMFGSHPIVSTRDPQVARDRVGEVFVAHDLRFRSRERRLDLVHNGVRFGGVGIHYMRYGGDVHVTPEQLERFWLVQIPIVGAGIDRIDGREVECSGRTASITPPDASLEMEWAAATTKLVVSLERDRIEEAVAATAGRAERAERHPLPTELTMDAASTRAWFRMVRVVADELDANDAMLDVPAVGDRLADAIVYGLLGAARLGDDAAEPARRGDTLIVTRTIDRLHDRPDHPWRLAELATEAGVSARALTEAFHRSVGTSPMQYLRRLRLDGVRRELRTADPTIETTTGIAGRWGFAHLGRFAEEYRRAFGELPSETLRG